MNETNHLGNRAPTVELNACVDDVEMYVYYIGGSCGARSFYGFNKGTPAQIIRGIVHSGCGGCVMYLIDVYEDGSKAAQFKEYVESNNLGTVDVSRPSPGNPYTGSQHVTAVFGYKPAVLAEHVAELEGLGSWQRPKDWYGPYDSIHMDSEFYQFGGRAKPAKKVRLSGINAAQSAASEAQSA